MLAWIPFAFVRIVVFFGAGIIVALYEPDIFPEPASFLIFLAGCGLYLTLVFARGRLNVNPGIPGFLTLFIAGYCNVQLHTDSRSSEHINNLLTPVEYYTAIVTLPAEERERSWKINARIVEVKTSVGWERRSGNVLLYLPKSDFPQPYSSGDKLLIEGAPQPVKGPANPGEFDYRNFLANRNIFHQHFIKGGKVGLLESTSPNWLLQKAHATRTWADGLLKKYIHGEREQALASALVLGVTDGLDNDLLHAYAATGAMHVLAVSGLHVGIIYWMILILFKPFQRTKSSKWILAALSLVILWAYALVTGLSPSVLRAVTMFSFMALARPWNQRTNIYNILAASAFCLLVYDPYMILSVGFQLSYLAVIGIVSLQPVLYRLWEPTYWLWDEIWKISAVSIAAQLATFALGLYYFHQFPNYFLISNLFVIPGSFLVLLLGLIILMVSFLSPLAAVLGWVLEWIIKILNGIIFAIERIPFSLTENLYINSLQCWIIVLMIGLIYFWGQTKKTEYAIGLIILCFIFSTAQWNHFRRDILVSKLTVYNIPGHTAIDLAENGHAYFVFDTLLNSDVQKKKFHISPNRIKGGIARVSPAENFIRQMEGCTLMVWNGLTIVQLHSAEFRIPPKLAIDYLIISNNAVKDLTGVVKDTETKAFIVDSSNSFYRADKLVKEAERYQLRIHSVLHLGAFDLII